MTDIHPIKSVISTPLLSESQVFFLYAIAISILSIITVRVLYFLWKKYFKTKETEEEIIIQEEDLRDYYSEAIQELKKIKILLHEENLQEFFLAITYTLKKFLSGNYKCILLELTTTEVEESSLPKQIKQDILALLEDMDEAKFKDKEFPYEEAEEIFSSVEKIIKKYKSV